MTENNIKKRYSKIEDYRELQPKEHIRERPGHYVGSTDDNGVHHLFQETIDNSIDEAENGRCDKIDVWLSADQKKVTIKDNGCGFPIGIYPDTGLSVLHTMFTSLNSGAKFKKSRLSDKDKEKLTELGIDFEDEDDIHDKEGNVYDKEKLIKLGIYLKDKDKDEDIYKTSGGLHGIGMTAVNHLTSEMEVVNQRQGETQRLLFSRGRLISEVIDSTPLLPDSFTVSLVPDKKIFKEFTHFQARIIQERLQDLSYLNPKLTLTFAIDDSSIEKKKYKSPEGISGWVKELVGDNALTNTKICQEEWSQQPIKSTKEKPGKPFFFLKFSWQYSTKQRKILVKSFCNNIKTKDGGTHVEGFEIGFVNALKAWIKLKKINLKFTITKEDIIDGLVCVLAVKMKDAQFSGQIKSSLTDSFVKDLVKNATCDLVTKFLQDNGSTSDAIIQKIINAAQHRIKTEEYQKTLRESVRSATTPDKLIPCVSKDNTINEIFLVEGISAAGSGKLARDPKIQAILPIKGKIINVEKANDAQIFINEEIKDVINALGLSVNEATNNNYNLLHRYLDDPHWETVPGLKEDFVYNDESGKRNIIPAKQDLNREEVKIIVEETRSNLLKKINYHKIIIMVDPDPDGGHIFGLCSVFFMRYFRYLIEEGRVYMALPPLYRWKTKQTIKYFFNDFELNDYKRQYPNATGHIERFKGLGEMDAIDLRETTMSVQKRHLKQLLIKDIHEVYKIINNLLGISSDFRRELLESGTHQNIQLNMLENNCIELENALLVKFITYAYTVVEERALPQVIDGLKPVQRKILFTFYELGLLPNKPHRKSSKIAGDVVGNYHPHDTASVYQAMVKMSQDFNYRYPLLKGQGNWGSQDGSPAAQMRYTEAKLSKFGYYLLEDLIYETVDYVDNYDNTRKMPSILPANLNLLLNGANGIAVGMNTNIPPHNLSELVDAISHLINNPESSLEELLERMPAPDFPTGGEILEQDKLKTIYSKGEGSIYIRSSVEIISSKNNEKLDTIRVYELPFKVITSQLLAEINRIIKLKKINGLRSVEDYSCLEDPVNIHIKFDPNYDVAVILNSLYKTTKLQTAFIVKIRALIGIKPKVISLKRILEIFITNRLQHIKRKAQFIFNKNQKELKGLEIKKFIIENHTRIVDIINNNEQEDKIKFLLNSEFNLNDSDINLILDTPATLRQFTPARKNKLLTEINNLELDNINWKRVVDEETVRKELLLEELFKLKNNYQNDKRRTRLSNKLHVIAERQLVAHEFRLALLSKQDNKKENKINNYLTVYNPNIIDSTNIPSQGKEFKTRGDNSNIIKINRRDDLFCFTNYGRLYIINFYKISTNKTFNLNEEYFIRNNKGNIETVFNKDEYITNTLTVPEETKANHLIIITKKGKIRFLSWEKINKIRTSGRKIINFFHKTIIKCEKHKEIIINHKIDPHVCGITCISLRGIRSEILICKDCKRIEEKEEDEIAKVAYINGDEELEVIVKMQSANNVIKNIRIPVYSLVRKKKIVNINGFDVQINQCCSRHEPIIISHWEQHNKEKTNCFLRCSISNSLQEIIRLCPTCQDANLFAKRPKHQIRLQKENEEVFDLLVIKKNVDRNDLTMLIVRSDNTLEKKPLSKVKRWIGSDSKLNTTRYCEKHWNDLDYLENEKEDIILDVEVEKDNYVKKVLLSALPKNKKEEILKLFFQQGNISKELLNKIERSNVDELLTDTAIDLQTEDLLHSSNVYQNLNVKLQEQEISINQLQENINNCSDCQKYCVKHVQEMRDNMIKHQNCPHCNLYSDNIKKIKEEIDALNNQLINLDINSITYEEESVKINDNLLSKKKLSNELRNKAFVDRNNCNSLTPLRDEIKSCEKCQKQINKKYVNLIKNAITKVLIFNNKMINQPEFYILAKDKVYFYNKSDVAQFLESEGRRIKSLIHSKSRKNIIDDFKFYSN